MWCDLHGADNKPSEEQVRDYIGTYLYDDLADYFRETHYIKAELIYSYGIDKPSQWDANGGSWKGWKYKHFEGWALKYAKSGVTLCTIYPQPGFFVALIKLEDEDLEEAYVMSQIFHQYTKEVFEVSNHDTQFKYVEIEVTNPEILEDVQHFINLMIPQPMVFEIEKKVEVFYRNVRWARKKAGWARLVVRHIAMLICTVEGRNFGQKAVEISYRIIKENNHIFSVFRGNRALCLAVMLSLEKDRKDFFAKLVTVDGMMRATNIQFSDFRVMASYLIVSQCEPEDYPEVVYRTKEFIRKIKRNSTWYIVSGEDYIYAAMFALTGCDYETWRKRIKKFYKELHPSFRYPGCTQAVSHFLALSTEDTGLAERTMGMLRRNTVYKYRFRLSRVQTVPILGLLMLLPIEVRILLKDISGAFSIIMKKKGFSSTLVTRQQRTLYAASLVVSTYIDEIKKGNLKIDDSIGVKNILLAQKVANIMAFMGCAWVASTAKADVEEAKPGGAPLDKYRKKV